MKGCIKVNVKYQNQEKQLPLVVVAGEGPSLLGCDCLAHIKLNWSSLHNVQSESVEQLLEEHKALFSEGLGTLNDYVATFQINDTVRHNYCKARPVPYAMKSLVEAELERLCKVGIIEPVSFSDWVAPIVPILKPDRKSIRICRDFKLTINQASKLDRYLIPKIEDLLATLAGEQKFTKSYQQVRLAEQAKQYVVVNTHKGLFRCTRLNAHKELFRYTRLPYGVASAPGIFQRVMENVLQDLSHTVVHLDDILITGKDSVTHLKNLKEVLS